MEIVSKDRLLEYHVSEGWEPLCRWLGKDVLAQEMPSGSAGPEFFARVETILKEWMKEVLWNIGYFLWADRDDWNCCRQIFLERFLI
jgi:hypothetical protein